MALGATITHALVATGTDAGDGEVNKAAWNDSHSVLFSGDNSADWDTAYSWGDHSAGGYLTTAAAAAAYQPLDADLTTWAGLTPSANAQSLVTAANYAAMRGLLDLEAGTDFYSIAAANAAFAPISVTQYTDELAQDAIGAMVDTSLTYVDGTPLLQRAALTGAITASAGSNTTALGSFTKAQLTTAVSDGDPLYVGDAYTTAGADAAFQPKDTQLTDIAGLAYAGNANKVLRVNAGETAFELAASAGGGNVSNTGTPVNNQVAVWTDATTIEGDAALTFDTATDTLSVGTGGVMVTGTIELGAATDTTISRAAAGVLAVEGVPILKATSGVGNTPTASGTTAITHGLGRTPAIIRIWGKSGFTSNAAATPTTSSEGLYTSSGNTCIYQSINGTTTIAAQTSTAFAIFLDTSVGNTISGVIQNVGATTFDIAWTETGTHTRGVYLWEAQ
jgi:hypothetical protein